MCKCYIRNYASKTTKLRSAILVVQLIRPQLWFKFYFTLIKKNTFASSNPENVIHSDSVLNNLHQCNGW